MYRYKYVNDVGLTSSQVLISEFCECKLVRYNYDVKITITLIKRKSVMFLLINRLFA